MRSSCNRQRRRHRTPLQHTQFCHWPATLTACRLGSSKSTGPSARLVIFHDGNALVGTALAVALHGSGAAWPLGFLCAGRRLVDACQAHKLRTSVACAAVWAMALHCVRGWVGGMSGC
jgi:hypothetical protein